jgi:hypothetical protein
MHIIIAHAVDYSILMTEPTGSSKIVVPIYQTMAQNIPQEDNLKYLFIIHNE